MAVMSVVCRALVASTMVASASCLDTASLLQRPEIPSRHEAPQPAQDTSEPFLIGLRRESVPIYRQGKIASFKTSYSGVLSVGTPAQNFRVVFDTGSGNIVLPAVECQTEACLVEGRRRFNMTASKTAVAVNTDGSEVPDGEASDQVTIGFGTGEITGEFAKDTVCFGSPSAHQALAAHDAGIAVATNTSTEVLSSAKAEAEAPARDSTSTELALAADDPALGPKELCVEMSVVLAVEMSTQPFKTFRFDGILGLGLDGLAMSREFSAFEMLFGTGLPEARFGVFLTEGEDGEESEIAMGGHDPRRTLEPLSFSPVVMPEYGYWQVEIVAVRINGVELDVCKDGTCRGVVDTGTSHLGIPAPADAEVAELLTTEAGDLLDCRLSEAPTLEIEVAGYNLTLHSSNYMRRLPLREGVSVSSAQGVYVPSKESNATLNAPSSADPVGDASNSPRSAEAPVYVKIGQGEYCVEGQDITTEQECRAAATSLGLEFEHSWEGSNDHRYCLYAEDGRSRVYFNVASESAAPTPPNPRYSSLCARASDARAAAQPAATAAPVVEAVPEVVRRFCRPRLMPVRLPAPLGPKLFILGEPVLHRYYTVYDWGSHSVGFSLANNRRNTMDPSEITDRQGKLPKEVDMLLMQQTMKISRGQDNSLSGSSPDDVTFMQVDVKLSFGMRFRERC